MGIAQACERSTTLFELSSSKLSTPPAPYYFLATVLDCKGWTLKNWECHYKGCVPPPLLIAIGSRPLGGIQIYHSLIF